MPSKRPLFRSYSKAKVYRSLMKTNEDFMWDFYTKKPLAFNVLTGEKLCLRKTNTTCYGLNYIIFRGSLV